MAIARNPRHLEAAVCVAVGLALGCPAAAWAQLSGPGVSSGSGAGTGTGTSAGSGLGTTGTGIESGSGLGTTGTGVESGLIPRAANIPGPGGLYDPLMGRAPMSHEELERMDAELLSRARQIADPAERARALEHVAHVKVLGRDLDEAQVALREAGQAALLVQPELARDRRIMAVIEALTILTDSQVREGTMVLLDLPQEIEPLPDAAPRDRLSWLRSAQDNLNFAADLASRLENPNFRSFQLFRVAQDESTNSQTLSDAARREEEANSEGAADRGREMRGLADYALVRAAEIASRIEMTVWHDRALDAVVTNAALSGQFARGLSIARQIILAQIRVDAFLRVAEAQARRNLNDDATRSYAEAAQAVASIPLPDPRDILAGVLIDNLISTGRFDDARASIVLYADPNRRIKALGAVAEAQGRRGLADQARVWIDRETPPEMRSVLRRRVIDGITTSLEQEQANDLKTFGVPTTPPLDINPGRSPR